MGLRDNESFLVFGLGKSGRAVARLLARKGKRVAVSDDSAAAVADAMASDDLRGLDGSVSALSAAEALKAIPDFDALVLSPGVPLEHAVALGAAEAGLITAGEIEVAFAYSDSPIIGVTGTNGKSTVVNMIGAIFESAGRKNVVAGNIGTPFSTVVVE